MTEYIGKNGCIMIIDDPVIDVSTTVEIDGDGRRRVVDIMASEYGDEPEDYEKTIFAAFDRLSTAARLTGDELKKAVQSFHDVSSPPNKNKFVNPKANIRKPIPERRQRKQK